MERYYEVSIKVKEGELEALTAKLFELGCVGTYIEESDGGLLVKAYFKNSVPKNFKEFQEVKNENWMDNWKKFFRPVKVGSFLIAPDFLKDEIKTDERTLFIHVGMAFGTGTHETTQLCIRLLEEAVFKGASVLDVGSGSGILSICAKKLGAKNVVACDIDPNAAKEIKINQAINAVEGIKFVLGSVSDVEGEFDVVVANIVTDKLLKIIDDVLSKAKLIIISGFLKEQTKDVLSRTGKKPLKILEGEEWAAALLKR